MGGLNATFGQRGAQVASYSSRGPDVANDRREAAEIMKPDAMAPGDMIWAAWTPKGNDDDNFAGNGGNGNRSQECERWFIDGSIGSGFYLPLPKP
jgi:hypothetical protein